MTVLIASGQPRPAMIPFTDGKLWGYADTAGRVRIAPQWEDVQFFRQGRATVRISGNGGRSPVFASIDTAGRYLIPPGAGWNGALHASGVYLFLNAFDSAGNGGTVDSNGRFVIPRIWQFGPSSYNRINDSMMVVYSDGLAGVIHRSGRVLVPCKWGAVSEPSGFSDIQAFLVTDPDNVEGANALGVTDLQGRLLVPARYNSVDLVRLADGKPAFKVFRRSSNDADQQSNSGIDGGLQSYLSYPDGRRLQEPRLAPTDATPEERLPGGLILTGRPIRVLDSNRNVVIPCCRFRRVKGDTLILMDEKPVGKNVLAVTFEYRSVNAPRTTLAKQRWLLQYENGLPADQSYAFRHYTHNAPPAFDIPYFGKVDGIYRDSLLLASPRVLDERGHMTVTGTLAKNPQNRQSYVALLDAELNYIIRPRPYAETRRYNAQSGLAVIVEYNRSGRRGETVITTQGEEVMHLPRGTINDVFRWRARTYAFITVQDECDPNPTGTHRYITDSLGTPLPAFSRYRVDAVAFVGGDYQVRAYDSAGQFALLKPDGSPLYPALSFRHNFLEPAVNGWFFATEPGGRKRFLVDSFNRNITPGMNIQWIQAASVGESALRQFADVFKLSAIDSSGQLRTFYLDHTGRSYATFL